MKQFLIYSVNILNKEKDLVIAVINVLPFKQETENKY